MHIPFWRELFAGARLDFPGIVVKMEGVWEPIRESGIFILRDHKAVDIQTARVDAPRGLGTPVDSAVTLLFAFEAGGRTLPWQDPGSALPAGILRRWPVLEPRHRPAPGAQAERKITE